MDWEVIGHETDIALVMRGSGDKNTYHLTTEIVKEGETSEWVSAHTVIARGAAKINMMDEILLEAKVGDTLPSRRVYSGAITWAITEDNTVAYCIQPAAKYKGFWHRGASFKEGDLFSVPFVSGPGLFVLVEGFVELNDVVYEVDIEAGEVMFFEIEQGKTITIKNSNGVGMILWKHPEDEDPETYQHPFVDTYQRGYKTYTA